MQQLDKEIAVEMDTTKIMNKHEKGLVNINKKPAILHPHTTASHIMRYRRYAWELKTQFHLNLPSQLSLITNEALKLMLQDGCSFSIFFLFFS